MGSSPIGRSRRAKFGTELFGSRRRGAMSDVAWSIVVPTYRRPRAVVETARALARLERPRGGFEVVVVDDGGAEPLEELAAFPNVRLLRQRNAGPAAARNAGARAARGHCVAFLDDDCRPEARWLVELDRALAGSEDAMVGGRTRNGLEDNAWAAASQDLVDAMYRRANEDGEARFFTSNNIGMSAAAFRAVGGFDASYPLAAGEDRAFCHAWRASGRRMIHAPEAVVLHHHEMGVRGFWRQHFRYGRGARRFYGAVESGELRERGLRGALAFGLEAVLQPLRSERGGRRGRRAAALALAQVATACGAAVDRIAARRRSGSRP